MRKIIGVLECLAAIVLFTGVGMVPGMFLKGLVKPGELMLIYLTAAAFALAAVISMILFANGVERFRWQEEWHMFPEEKPDEYRSYWCITSDRKQLICDFGKSYERDTECFFANRAVVDVIAWQELTELPEAITYKGALTAFAVNKRNDVQKQINGV